MLRNWCTLCTVLSVLQANIHILWRGEKSILQADKSIKMKFKPGTKLNTVQAFTNQSLK